MTNELLTALGHLLMWALSTPVALARYLRGRDRERGERQ